MSGGVLIQFQAITLYPPSKPPRELALDQAADQSHPALGIVEAGNGGKTLAAGVAEDFGVLHRDLLERLQAIGRKAGHHDGEILDARSRQRPYRFVGGGLEPFGATEARLEGQAKLALIELQPLAQQA